MQRPHKDVKEFSDDFYYLEITFYQFGHFICKDKLLDSGVQNWRCIRTLTNIEDGAFCQNS